jgi:hypothetical protein
MQHQSALLLNSFDGHIQHRRTGHGLADSLRICSIILRSLDITLHVARMHPAYGMAELDQLSSPVVCRAAGFHADETRSYLAKKSDNLLATQLPCHDGLAADVYSLDLEDILGEINADGFNIHLGDPSQVSRLLTISLRHIAESGRRPLNQFCTAVNTIAAGRFVDLGVSPPDGPKMLNYGTYPVCVSISAIRNVLGSLARTATTNAWTMLLKALNESPVRVQRESREP